MEVARAPFCCSASTSRRLDCWNTLRTIASASGVVTRRPLTVCSSMPAAAVGIELRAGAVQHDRGQPDFLQERQRGRQRLQVVAQHRAADLDHGEALGVQLREALEVLADLCAGHAREQAHDGLAGLAVGCMVGSSSVLRDERGDQAPRCRMVRTEPA